MLLPAITHGHSPNLVTLVLVRRTCGKNKGMDSALTTLRRPLITHSTSLEHERPWTDGSTLDAGVNARIAAVSHEQ